MSRFESHSPGWGSLMSEVGTRTLRLMAVFGGFLILLTGVALGRFLATADTAESLDRMRVELETLRIEATRSHQQSLHLESLIAMLQGRLESVRMASLSTSHADVSVPSALLTRELDETLAQRQRCLNELNSHSKRGRAIPSQQVANFAEQVFREHLGFVREVARQQQIPLTTEYGLSPVTSPALTPPPNQYHSVPVAFEPMALTRDRAHSAAAGVCFAPPAKPSTGYTFLPKPGANQDVASGMQSGVTFSDEQETQETVIGKTKTQTRR